LNLVKVQPYCFIPVILVPLAKRSGFSLWTEAKVAAAKERIEKLRQSILAKAFSGQLVETEAEMQEEKAGIMRRRRFCLVG
jgi:hypothetical protein